MAARQEGRGLDAKSGKICRPYRSYCFYRAGGSVTFLLTVLQGCAVWLNEFLMTKTDPCLTGPYNHIFSNEN
ncbi:MAG: hypothetical protein COA65_09240 [Rhodospirillaceae bacterium]|nr:MAG: hypothetical protein COA65_09240 [Rhodospirillaceae bacterium]